MGVRLWADVRKPRGGYRDLVNQPSRPVHRLMRWGVALFAVLAALNWRGAGLAVTAFILMVLPLVLLFRRPWLCWALTTLLTAVLVPYAHYEEAVVLAGLLAIYLAVALLAFHRSWRTTLPAMLASALIQLALLAFFLPGIQLTGSGPIIVLVMLCVYLVANSSGEARRRSAVARVRETELAIEAERLRIAREMHDLIAHSLGVIAIQAG